ncbi:ImmA/IrrE family metallo-endopeptidase [Streptomyces sp. NPDC049577]|uniref:ImmA/IrrE family metallo-endopeptidase n=1 Tax=Streptomyces sp. NPDC049577 TaxID=3155153 RepID=UPI00343DD856
MNFKRLHQRCRKLVRGLDIPSPFDIWALCDSVAERHGRPIRPEPLRLPPDGPCGLWVSTPDVDYIFYAHDTSPLHQEHIIAHELGHVICGHEESAVLGEETSRLVLPTLDPEMVRGVLRRTYYTSAEEQEAEMVASLILQAANRTPLERNWDVPSEAAATVERLDRSLRGSAPDEM